MDEAKRVNRRRHGEQLKRQVLAECAAPGASVAQVALAHGLNTNLVHKWRRLAAPASFVPVAVRPSSVDSAAPLEPIRLELQRGVVSVRVHWPLSAADQCAAWLREIWR